MQAFHRYVYTLLLAHCVFKPRVEIRTANFDPMNRYSFTVCRRSRRNDCVEFILAWSTGVEKSEGVNSDMAAYFTRTFYTMFKISFRYFFLGCRLTANSVVFLQETFEAFNLEDEFSKWHLQHYIGNWSRLYSTYPISSNNNNNHPLFNLLYIFF